MSHLPQNIQSLQATPIELSPFKLTLAKDLNQAIALNEANAILCMDTLNKVEQLSKLESLILEKNPKAEELTKYVLREFTYRSCLRLK